MTACKFCGLNAGSFNATSTLTWRLHGVPVAVFHRGLVREGEEALQELHNERRLAHTSGAENHQLVLSHRGRGIVTGGHKRVGSHRCCLLLPLLPSPIPKTDQSSRCMGGSQKRTQNGAPAWRNYRRRGEQFDCLLVFVGDCIEKRRHNQIR